MKFAQFLDVSPVEGRKESINYLQIKHTSI